MAQEWYHRTGEEACRELDVSPAGGLGSEEAARRLEEHGRNVLATKGAKSPWAILYEQFTSLMILLLIGAGVVSGPVLHEWTDMTVIFVVVLLNAALGFQEEYKAEKAMEALKKMAVPASRVRRDGRTIEVSSEELVPGDVLLVEAGTLVPADCLLLEAANLQAREAALTGEAVPVSKAAGPLEEEEPALGDRRNMLYRGTVVTYGRGKGLVVATGMKTEIGGIADLIESAEEEQSVLQQKLDRLGKLFVGAAVILIGVVGLEGWLLLHLGPKALFLTGVSVAVAAIPEGLPAAVTIALALGAQRMLKRRALIRRLPSTETLGSVTVICSDKTGTLTQNRMLVTEVRLPGTAFSLDPDEKEKRESLQSRFDQTPAAGVLFAGMALCTDATVDPPSAGEEFRTLGDPTEGALVAAAAWAGYEKEALEKALPRVNELPFESDRKRMTTVHALPERGDDYPAPLRPLASLRGGGRGVAFTKGAVDSVLDVCDRVWRGGEAAAPLDDETKEEARAANESLAGKGIRVLALAMRPLDDPEAGEATREESLVYLGLVGMLDPLRPEVKEAVARCQAAGIRPVMITGDHPLIARHIGSQLGLEGADAYLAGKDLAAMSREELQTRVRDVSVFARVAPEHKLRIVDAFQKNGHVVAMTGDGVNDAPALKEADIGVAMGITGTDVSKEAADMVLQDDNFATIEAAVEEGRTILDNIIRFVRYILASNAAEVLIMLAAPLAKLPLPLLPAQVLWMNLVTDGLPALALGVEPAERDIMSRPPRDPRAPVIDLRMGLHILWVGALMAGMGLLTGLAWYEPAAGGEAAAVAGHAEEAVRGGATWQTMIFTVMVLSQFTLALGERSSRDSILRIGLGSNRYMLGALAICLPLQLGVIYLPFLQKFFDTVPLSAGQFAICFAASFLMLFAVEAEKAILRWRRGDGRKAPAE